MLGRRQPDGAPVREEELRLREGSPYARKEDACGGLQGKVQGEKKRLSERREAVSCCARVYGWVTLGRRSATTVTKPSSSCAEAKPYGVLPSGAQARQLDQDKLFRGAGSSRGTVVQRCTSGCPAILSGVSLIGREDSMVNALHDNRASGHCYGRIVWTLA